MASDQSEQKHVYFFGETKSDKNLLGGKGAGLNEMTKIGIPVPPGFVITTEACREFFKNGSVRGLDLEVEEAILKLERITGKKFGSPKNPLLVSVRSGAPVSMPGMMDTILNLGMNEDTAAGLTELSGDSRFAYDCYRRFIQMFGNVVLGIKHEEFEKIIEEAKKQLNKRQDTELTAEDWKEVIRKYKKLVLERTGKQFPENPRQQLKLAIEAVFNSWKNERAITYRKLNNIPDEMGTAVNVQAMVFGNLGDDSATGVAFTRNPSTGQNEFYGEFLINAQGEDVVAGIRTPKPISELKKEMPETYEQLLQVRKKLESHYKDMQDIEFTVERGKLFLLQTRSGKRSAYAAVKIALDMLEEGIISEEEALLRIEPAHLNSLMHKRIDPNAKLKVIAKGLGGSPGAASGLAVFSADEAELLGKEGKSVILVRSETSPDDIHGMAAAQGILTARGGLTSHAAVVARGMGKCCVVGCEDIVIDEKSQSFKTKSGIIVKHLDSITINGTTGEVILGEVKLVEPELGPEFRRILEIADRHRRLGVKANADIPRDAIIAKKFGAEGIGLCRTEHMFFAEERLPIMQEMILADNEVDRRRALEKLLPMQRADFYGLFKEMEGFPVIIRLLDPPLHEFLPKREELMVELALAKERKNDPEKIEKLERLLKRVESLHEFNPMLGHRGCRLGIVYPEITEMQARAIFQAACSLAKEGKSVMPEVMIPIVSDVKEFVNQKKIVDAVAEQVIKEEGIKINYKVGTMIELPRAALLADEIAGAAEFFSFGTNDLTQTTFGFSRDDSGKFIRYYLEHGILEKDPFAVLDRRGVGKLVEMAVRLGKEANKQLEVGICGEHGGDPESIEFCHKAGLDYVSCSPFRVPIARLAAARAAVLEKIKQ
ncbi:MAG: pyruvate, phosphate dikinase [Candidatus Woesearchaeota archaeon]